MAEQDVVIKIAVQAEGGAQSLSSLKKEFRETQATLEGLDTSSKDYIKTLQRLGALKDDMGDLRAEIESFNPEGRIQAVGNVIGGLASGFQAAQGGMALLGVQGEALQATLLKVNAASAFADGIKGVIGMGDSVKVLISNLKSFSIGQKLVTAAQWLWNAAMAANPIGLLVAGVAALVGGIALLVSAQDDAAEAQLRMNELEKQQLEQREKDIELIKKKAALLNETSNFELELAKALGKSSAELYKIEHDNIQKKIDDIELLKWYRVNGELTPAELLEINKLNREKSLLETKYKTDTLKEGQKLREKDAELNKKAAEDKNKEQADTIEYSRKYFMDLANEEKDAKQAAWDEQVEIDINNFNKQFKAEQEREKERLDTLNYSRDLFHQQDLQRIEEKKALEKESLQATQALTDLAFTLKLNSVKKGSAEETEILKKQFQVNKAFQVVNATINGIQAVQAIMATAVDPTGVTTSLRIGASIVMSAANIAKIAATQFNGGGSSASAGSLSSASGGVGIAPPSTGSTMLNANGTIIKQRGNETPTVKAVVVESDITQTQNRINTIKEIARI